LIPFISEPIRVWQILFEKHKREIS
jgi:hypothetical protein